MPDPREFLDPPAAGLPSAARSNAIVVDPAPQFEISSWLYMQFMEPLGITDNSVEACWDYEADDWREDFVDVARDLAPGAIRFGGLFSRYYKWREGIGPAAKRPPMRNYIWGGWETNRIGTDEFIELCRRVDAEPFFCVNFLSDGARARDRGKGLARPSHLAGSGREARRYHPRGPGLHIIRCAERRCEWNNPHSRTWPDRRGWRRIDFGNSFARIGDTLRGLSHIDWLARALVIEGGRGG